jgi:hypothetical protein
MVSVVDRRDDLRADRASAIMPDFVGGHAGTSLAKSSRGVHRMLGHDQNYAPLALSHVETMCTALSEYPVHIEVWDDDALDDGWDDCATDDSFGEIAIFPNDPGVEILT